MISKIYQNFYDTAKVLIREKYSITNAYRKRKKG